MNRDDMHTCHSECQRPICVAVREAVAAEREACADIAENWKCNGMPRTVLADQIRARGAP
jgi:hypothetical protein